MGSRRDGREPDDMRVVAFTRDYTEFAAGSVLVEFGRTRVLCTASVEERVPPWMRGTGQGWVTAEYSMLPGSSPERVGREAAKGKQSGRTQEIQRLIGRSMRTIVDLVKLGERTVWMDCDVIQADGGTRCASITGSFTALVLALDKLRKSGVLNEIPVRDYVAAVSVGIVGGKPILDLDYDEDSAAEVDMNVVMTGAGKFIEIQGTAEREPFSKSDLEGLLALAKKGIGEFVAVEKKILRGLI